MTTNKATLTREIQRLYNHEHEAKMEIDRLTAEVEALKYENQRLWESLNKKRA